MSDSTITSSSSSGNDNGFDSIVYDSNTSSSTTDVDIDDGSSIPVTASVKVHVDLNLPGQYGSQCQSSTRPLNTHLNILYYMYNIYIILHQHPPLDPNTLPIKHAL